MKCLNVRMFGMFDWRKGTMCLLSVVALCAFTGSAADQKEEEWEHDTDPIIHLIGDFILSTAPEGWPLDLNFQNKLAEKLAEYDARIASNDRVNEAYVCRALTLLTSLSHYGPMELLVSRFGFNVLDQDGTIKFTRQTQGGGFDTLVRENDAIDEACEIAVPVLKEALADLGKVSKDWTDGMEISEEKGYSVNETVYFDYADSLLTRAAISEMISVLYLMKGYNTLAADGQSKDIDLAALKESQRWMYSAAVQVNAFTEAANERDDLFKNNFFMPKWIDIMLLRENAQNLVNVPYWTVRFNLDYLSQYLYLNGPDRTEEKDWKRERLYGKTLDVSFRSLFEGKVRRAYGTFPEFDYGKKSGLPILDTLADSTCGGMFPGLSRTELAYLLRATSGRIADTTDSDIAYYGVRYLLPEGAVNDPRNPAAFEADLESAITLLYPTMSGYYFTGWSRDVVIRDGVIPDGAAETLVFTGRFAQDTSEDEVKQGTPDNPWEIGMVRPADVKAWLDDAGKLTIAGTGKVKDFTLVEAPWYSVRHLITALEIGSGVTALGELAFNDCHELTSVTIPSSVELIEKGAFYGCPLTRVIEMREELPRLRAGAFGSPSQFKGTIFVPDPSVGSYKTASVYGWTDYADAICGMTLVTLPSEVGYRYVVRELSLEEAEIEPTEAGGTTYALPIGTRVSIDVVEPEEPGYVVVGDSYVIGSVEWGMTIDESLLPRVVSEALYQTGTGSDGETYTSEVENGSEGDVENPVKVSAIEGLIDIATSLNTNVTLKVAAKDAASVDPDVAAAVSNELEKVSAGGFDSVAFVDLSIFFDGEAQENCELGTVIKLHIPWQVKSGDTYGVVRMHNDKAQVIPQGEANKTSDGEYFEVDFEKGELVLCIGKFSDYAIAEETPPLKVGENATATVEDGVCTISGEGSVTNFPSGFDCGSISNAVVGKDIIEIGEGFFYPCLSLKSLEIKNVAAATGLEKAVVYRTAINPDGTLYPIPTILIPGYKEVLYGANDPTGKDGWQQVHPGTRMEESGYHFFKYVLTRE